MATHRPSLDDLPEIIPVFPISGALLLPGGRLPLTVFEPRYMALVEDALGHGRLFGVVQPATRPAGAAAGLHAAGCLGRIASFAETPDGRILLSVIGVCRFKVVGEEAGASGYRRLRVDYRPWAADLFEDLDTDGIERSRLVSVVRAYLSGLGVAVDWRLLDDAPDTLLVTTLAMTCPLSPAEKQALLETLTLADRCRMMTAMIEMALLGERGGSGGPVH